MFKMIFILLLSSCVNTINSQKSSTCEANVDGFPSYSIFAEKCKLYKGREHDVALETHAIRYMLLFSPLFGPAVEKGMYARPAIKDLCMQKGFSGDVKIALLDQWYGWCL